MRPSSIRTNSNSVENSAIHKEPTKFNKKLSSLSSKVSNFFMSLFGLKGKASKPSASTSSGKLGKYTASHSSPKKGFKNGCIQGAGQQSSKTTLPQLSIRRQRSDDDKTQLTAAQKAGYTYSDAWDVDRTPATSDDAGRATQTPAEKAGYRYRQKWDEEYDKKYGVD